MNKKDHFWSNIPPRAWPLSIKPLYRVPYLPQSGKKLAFYPKKKTNVTKKRKEDAMNKAAAKAAKKPRKQSGKK